MADLYIDFAALQRTRQSLAHIEDTLGQSCARMRDFPADAAGHPDLTDKLRRFGDEWEYGIGKLGQFSGGCREALDAMQKTFADLDRQLAAALQPGDPA
jgi:hypothetical protein